MATQPPRPIIHVFKEYNIGKFKTTKHYLFESANHGDSLLTDKINISKDRNCAKSTPDYWLQIRKNNKWVTPRFTGLFKTGIPLIYHGDQELNGTKTHQILFQFSKNAEILKIYFFKDYYTPDFKKLLPLIQ